MDFINIQQGTNRIVRFKHFNDLGLFIVTIPTETHEALHVSLCINPEVFLGALEDHKLQESYSD